MGKGIRRRSDDSTTSIDSTSSGSPVSLTPLNYRRPYLYVDQSVAAADTGPDPSAILTSWTDTILQSATSTCWVEEDYPPARGQLAAPWTEWFDSGIEFFGCEGDGTDLRRKHLSGRTMLLPKSDSLPLSGPSHEATIQLGNDKSANNIDSRTTKNANQDYAKLHEAFFESLLKEQGDLATLLVLKQTESRDSHAASSVSSGYSSVSSGTLESVVASSNTPHTKSLPKNSTRRRPFKLHRLTEMGRNKKKSNNNESVNGITGKNNDHHQHHSARIAPIEAYNEMFNPALTSNETTISLPEIVAKEALHGPVYYVHPKCLLQKDRGRGDAPKTCISAVGRDSCLEKLRDKMRLVVQVAGEERKASTGLKRRVAKVSSVTESYVETRSMIEMQLGFLSMQYGLLFHWDTSETGKIIYICLRKMCHDSFYSKIPSSLTQNKAIIRHPKQRTRAGQKHREFFSTNPPSILPPAKKSPAPPLVVRTRRGNHAIYQRSSGATEVVLVSPPYRVPHPEVFAPSVLTVDIHQIAGLEEMSEWTLSVTFDGQSEVAHLHYNDDRQVFETTGANPFKWEMIVPRQMTSFDAAGLEIRLFERQKSSRKNSIGGNRGGTTNNNNISSNSSVASNGSTSSGQQFSLNVGRNQQQVRGNMKTSKKSTSRLASTMTMPLGGLVSQPCTSQTTVWKLTMPFTHDERAQVTFTLTHQSDYAHWLYQELRARRKEMGAASSLLSSGKGGPSWRTSLLGRWGVSQRSTNDKLMVYDSDDDDNGDDEVVEPFLMEWLCGICVK
jgi:hypothetical protein